MKKENLFLFALLSLSFVFAQDALHLMEQARNKTKIKGFESISTLTIRDAKNRTRTRKTAMISKSYPDEKEKRLIRFIEPADVKGMSMLIIDKEQQDDEMWVYIPANKQSRRIVSKEKSKSFMGSEFSNADMTAPNLLDFHFTLLQDEIFENRKCWKIQLSPISENKKDEYGYHHKISWLDQKDTIIIRSDYYDFDLELFKTLRIHDYQAVNSKKQFVITNMQINNINSGRSSDMIMDKMVYNQSIPDKYFTTSYLENP